MMVSATLGDALCLALRYMPLLQGNGVKVIDPRTGGAKDFTFSGYHALAQIADLDGQPGAEIVGRTSTGIYVISNASSRKDTASAPAPGHSMAAPRTPTASRATS